MKKNLVKAITLALSATFILASCSAKPAQSTPSGSNGTSSSPSSVIVPKEIVDINVMVYERGQEYPSGMSTVDHALTRWINEQLAPLGVKANYIPIPRSGADDKINLLLSGNEAPDVVMTYDLQRVSTYGSQGGLLDLTPYVDRLDKGWLKDFEDKLQYASFDGKQYALPRPFEIYGKSHMAYIRQDLVEGAGQKMPTNAEELVDVLYAIKQKYPEVVPYAFGGQVTDSNFMNFILSYTSRKDERANHIYEPTFTRIFKDGGKEGLKQLNQFVLDGVIKSDFALDTDNTKFNETIANGNAAFVLTNGTACMQAYGTSGKNGYKMVPIDVFKDADGSYAVPSSEPVSNYVYVPKVSEKKIDAIMAYLGWISNYENALNIEDCITGIGTTVEADGTRKRLPEAEMKAKGLPTSPNDLDMLRRGFDFGAPQRMKDYKTAWPDIPQDVLDAYEKITYTNFYDPAFIPSALASDQYVPLLQTKIVEFVFKCMNAPAGQFDAVYEKEFNVLVQNHMQEVLDERAKWYDDNKK